MSILQQQFVELYGGTIDSVRTFFAPGRVNLIGEHTDYNGGYVFPAALTFGTTICIRRREDDQIQLASTNYDGIVHPLTSEDLSYKEQDGWMNYPKGMLVHLQKHGLTLHGYDVLYSGNIPGSGLSSSASILVATGFAFTAIEGEPWDRIQIALIAQEAENQYIGVNCGIMDQFSIAMGQKYRALMLKCDTLEYEQVPFEANGMKLIITNTNKRRGLVDSEYNARRSQCEQAVTDLRVKFPGLKVLAELNGAQLEENIALIKDENVRKRARHVIEENDRVLASVKALKSNDLVTFGQLMIQSHESLQHQFEVSCHELDILVEEALKIDGVLGSRMTGAGFGGCTVTLIKDEGIPTFIEQVGQTYTASTGLVADFYVAELGDGVREVK
jgi:galactokinase